MLRMFNSLLINVFRDVFICLNGIICKSVITVIKYNKINEDERDLYSM